MGTFSNRELAIAIWTAALFLLSIKSKGVRVAIGGLLKAVCGRHILTLLLLLVCYMTCVVWLWSLIGVWQPDQLKTTILWFALSGVMATGRAASEETLPNLISEWIKDTLRFTILIEFVVTNFTFGLWGELLLVPVTAVISMLVVVADRDPAHGQVKSLMEGALAVIGLTLIGRGIYLLVSNWTEFAVLDTAREFYTPPLLGVSLIPFVYIVYFYAQYELALTRMRFSMPDRRLRDYAMGIALLTFGPRTHLLRRWLRDIGANKPNTRADVLKSMQSVLTIHRREKSLPTVAPTEGWCPIRAGRFLEGYDLRTNDYHELCGEWFSQSQMKELNNGLPADNLAYYVEGNSSAATELRLSLNVNSDLDPEGSEIELLSALQELIEKATEYRAMFEELKAVRQSLDPMNLDNAQLSWAITPHRADGYNLQAKLKRL